MSDGNGQNVLSVIYHSQLDSTQPTDDLIARFVSGDSPADVWAKRQGQFAYLLVEEGGSPVLHVGWGAHPMLALHVFLDERARHELLPKHGVRFVSDEVAKKALKPYLERILAAGKFSTEVRMTTWKSDALNVNTAQHYRAKIEAAVARFLREFASQPSVVQAIAAALTQ